MRHSLLLASSAAIAVAAAPAVAPLPAQERAAPVVDAVRLQMTRLEMDIAVDYDERTLSGAALITLRNTSDRPVARVPLQLHRLMRFTGATARNGAGLPVDQDIVTYVDAARRQVNQGWITLPRPLAAGASTALRVRWEGFLWGYTETGSLYIRDRVDSAFTILREDALAFPGLAVPSWRANRARARGDFEFVVRVTVPAHQVVATGGTFVGRTEEGGRATYTYRSAIPVPFVNIPIAPYRVLERGQVRVYHFPADSVGAAMVMDAILGAADRLTTWFGPLGGELRLTVMEIPDGYGSQASLGAGIIQQAAAFRDRKQLSQLYHELTHLWNAPDADAPPVRWNEGLASFLEEKLAAELDGDGGTAGLERYVSERYLPWFLGRFRSDSSNLTTPFIRFGEAGKTDLSYGVGLLMFYTLHELVGAEAFNRAVGGWYQERRARGGTTEEFVAHVQRSVPLDLAPFFQDWMYTTRWYERLARGESLPSMIAGYRTGAGSPSPTVDAPR